MHPAVVEVFPRFSTPLEGLCRNLYADVKGLLTTAIGCLVDPMAMALPLPWVMPDGAPASQAEIARQWQAFKAQPGLKNYPALSKTVLDATTMRLTDAGVAQLVSQRLLANEKVLRGYFPNWDLFPADAQLACCSMAWAIGAGWPHIFGNLRDACNAQNWTTAIACCEIQTAGNPGVIPRNAANKLCFANAAAAIAQNLPLDVLHWPSATPDASQRDQALRQEAEFALTNMPALDLSHDADSAAAYEDEPTQPNTGTPPTPTGPAQS
jgi:hypothetical protein